MSKNKKKKKINCVILKCNNINWFIKALSEQFLDGFFLSIMFKKC